MAETKYIELALEKPKPKRTMNDAQLASLEKGRAKKLELDAATKENKANARLEARFDKLVAMFEKVQLPASEVQDKIKAKRASKPPPPEDDEDDDEDEPVEVEKPRKPVVVVQPQTKVLRFC